VCGGKILIATAGGIKVPNVKEALKAGADILVVGRVSGGLSPAIMAGLSNVLNHVPNRFQPL